MNEEKYGIYCCIKDDAKEIVTLIDYCKKHKIDNYYLYIDKVMSKNDIKNRKALNKLKRDVKNKKINSVIFSRLENISRDTIFNIQLLNYISSNGCKIYSSDGQNIADLENLEEHIKDICDKYANIEKKEQLNKKKNIEREER